MIRIITFIVLLVSTNLSSQDVLWPTRLGKFFSSTFGEIRGDKFHVGLDIKTGGRTGMEVLAVEDGYISRIRSDYNGYGKALYQRTNSGHEVVYGHLESFIPVIEKVWRLQQAKRLSYNVDAQFSPRDFQVKKGDLIGFSGNTGHSFAPHIHFEYRSSKSEPLNPLIMAYNLEDNTRPIAKNLAVIPISQRSMVNASPLTQIFPLFRDKSGIYHFADTISVFGEFGFAIQAVDKRQGTNNIYQFHRVELLVDGRKEFELEYNKIPFKQSRLAKTIIQYDLMRQNEGEFQKLYRLQEHKKTSIHTTDYSGILGLAPGVHNVIINIFDAFGNKTIVKGVIAGTFPMTLEAKEIFRDKSIVTLALIPRRGGLPIRDAVLYSFTPYGFANQKIDIIAAERVKKDLHITMPLQSIKNSVLQIIGINEIGGMINPYHWSNIKTKVTILDVNPDLKISSTERGLFFQITLDHYVKTKATVKLANDNTFMSYPMSQIQPCAYITDKLDHNAVKNMKYIDVELKSGDLSRQTRFHYNLEEVGPGKESYIFSNDRNCSMKTLPGTFYQTNAVWINEVEEYTPVNRGFHLSPVYQLQPYDLALKGKFQIGIRYNKELVEHSNLGIYYYDQKEEKWVYNLTENNRRKLILTSTMGTMDAITIIQDLDSPMIKNTIPGNGGRYNQQDFNKISIQVDDHLSGIESTESSFDLLLNEKTLYPSYQPIKKIISYNFDKPLKKGSHKIEFKVRDRMNNESSETIYFSII